MMSRPGGTVTMLFTDIEGSTRLLQELGPRYAPLLEDHRRLLRHAFAAHAGYEDGTEGDASFAVFPRASDGLAAAVDAQRALTAHSWPSGMEVRVRMGLHTGDVVEAGGGYVGMAVHTAARVGAAGHGGQIVLTDVTRELAGDPPSGAGYLDLGRHRLKDIPSAVQLFQIVHPDLPDAFPPLRAHGSTPHNLPSFATPFIGRTDELPEFAEVLSRGRLATVVGAGGAGKTRFAIRAAVDALDRYADGAWLVELAPATSAAGARQALAQAMPVQDADPIDWLKGRECLIVLDNCEHLVEAAAALTDDLLRSCPRVRVLATSREPLGIPGEVVWRLPSLPATEAVSLFSERASAENPRYQLTESNRPAVQRICQRLDGIPLAIELAAGRLGALSVEQVADRLDQRFRLLTGGSRVGLARQRTLQATVDWSYELLSEPERLLLRRLGVFAGASLEAVVAVCGDESLDEFDVIDMISQLVGKSLVVADDTPRGVRYRLLETIRQYAIEKLVAEGELEAARDRHLEWALTFSEEAWNNLAHTGPELQWLEVLRTELDNMRAAIDWASTTGREELAVRIAGALLVVWITRHIGEGFERLSAGLEAVEPSGGGWWRRAVVGCVTVAWNRLDFETTDRLLETEASAPEAEDPEAAGLAAFLEMYRHAIPFWRTAPAADVESLVRAASAVVEQGVPYFSALAEMSVGQAKNIAADPTSPDHFHRALEIGKVCGASTSTCRSLLGLAYTAMRRGDYAEAGRWAEQALQAGRRGGDTSTITSSLRVLALIAATAGDHQRGLAFAEEALMEMPEDRTVGRIFVLNHIAWAKLWLGDVEEAWQLLEQPVEYAVRTGFAEAANLLHTAGEVERARGNPGEAARLLALGFERGGHGVVPCLQSLAGLCAVSGGDPADAARLFGAAARIGHPPPEFIEEAQARSEADLTAAQQQLGAGWDAAFGEGRSMSDDDVLDLVRRTAARLAG